MTRRLILIALSLVTTSLHVAVAATLTVNTTTDNSTAADGRCTLREAIANVNAAADTTSGDCLAGSGAGDAIGFTVSGTIRLALGQLTVWRDVSITSPGSQSLRIDGANKTRVLEIAAGTTSISRVTIQRGRGAFVAGSVYAGGGILVDNGATLALADCTLIKNLVGQASSGYDDFFEDYGGAIFNSGTLSLDRCTISKNRLGTLALYNSTNAGAAIYNDVTGVLTLTDCVLAHNLAFAGPGGVSFGGAIANDGTMALTRCTLSRNKSKVKHDGPGSGGAIENKGVAALESCALSSNMAGAGSSYGEGYGGAIDNTYYNGTLTVSNCTFTDNSVRGGSRFYGLGGAIRTEGTATVVNSTLIGNSVRAGAGSYFDVYAGAIWSGVGTVTTVTNCTVTNNIVKAPLQAGPGGIGGYGVTLTNSIIAESGEGGNCDFDGSAGHNISDDDTCGSDPTKPGLAPLRNYGGPTRTRALCTAALQPHPACTGPSPAIDAGDDSVTGSPANLSTDQRGLPRQAGAHVDIGAYEVQ